MGLVVVTGAARNFGFEVVSAFARSGYDVVGAIRQPGVERVAGVRWVEWDVTSDDTTSLRESVGHQPVDVLVNNAGIGCPEPEIATVSVSRLAEVMDVNVYGVIRATQALLPNLHQARAPLILNISSRLASIADQAEGAYSGLRTSYAYRVSKAAQNMLTVSMANELGPKVRVWAVHPGELATSMGQSSSTGSPAVAAERLVALARSSLDRSSRFCSLGRADLRW